MHKDEFYAIFPKDAKNIKCTVEVFKKKSARYRLKPRMVSFQGRKDDVTPNAAAKNIVSKLNQRNSEKYIVPARRYEKKRQATDVLYSKTHISIEHIPVQLVVVEDIKPRFRTPGRETHLGEHTMK